MSGICDMCARRECIGRDDARKQCDKYLGHESNYKVGCDVEQVGNQMTCITLGSYADTEFVRWVDWAYAFAMLLKRANITDEKRSIVRRVINMEEIE